MARDVWDSFDWVKCSEARFGLVYMDASASEWFVGSLVLAATPEERRCAPTFPLTGRCANGVFVPFMKVVSSIKSAKKRHPACQVVRRKGRIYVINKVEPRYKARQG